MGTLVSTVPLLNLLETCQKVHDFVLVLGGVHFIVNVILRLDGTFAFVHRVQSLSRLVINLLMAVVLAAVVVIDFIYHPIDALHLIWGALVVDVIKGYRS